MKDSQGNIVSWLASCITISTGAMSTNDKAQFILICVGIASAIISLIYNIYAFFKKALRDGKIDDKEKKELGNLVSIGVKEIKEETEKLDVKPQKND